MISVIRVSTIRAVQGACMGLAIMAGLGGGSAMARPSPTPAERQVLAAEDAYAHAVVARDGVALTAALSSDLTYIHASGLAQDHDAYLHGAIAGLPAKIAGIAFGERQARVDDRTAYVQGVVIYDLGQQRRARYVSVWRRAAGGWRLSFWQNTAWPEAPVAGSPAR